MIMEEVCCINYDYTYILNYRVLINYIIPGYLGDSYRYVLLLGKLDLGVGSIKPETGNLIIQRLMNILETSNLYTYKDSYLIISSMKGICNVIRNMEFDRDTISLYNMKLFCAFTTHVNSMVRLHVFDTLRLISKSEVGGEWITRGRLEIRFLVNLIDRRITTFFISGFSTLSAGFYGFAMDNILDSNESPTNRLSCAAIFHSVTYRRHRLGFNQFPFCGDEKVIIHF